MLDDLRQQASESDYLKGIEPPPPPVQPKKVGILQLLSPMQRFIVTLLLFAASIVIGFVVLLATGTVVIPK
ncbi:MAG: hypothetical protein WBV22_10590 [Anaerolineaceae bacterium]